MEYIIRSGDSLWGIAQAFEIADWHTIYDHPSNEAFRQRFPNPQRILVGAKLQIPGREGDPKQAMPVIAYIVDEMKRNAACSDTKKMLELNSVSTIKRIEEWRKLPWWRQIFNDPAEYHKEEMRAATAAMVLWVAKVRQGGDWDHKPKIAQRFKGASRNTYHQLGWRYEYFYDIWSNLHYGYVGAAAGFSESKLLDGAGMEQIGSTLARFRPPQQRPGVQGMRSWDDESDQAAIQKGIQLFKQGGLCVSAVRAWALSANVTRREIPRR
jgi:hypothetical protein